MYFYLPDGPSASTLQYAWKPLISYNTCNTQTGNAGEIDRTMMCAGDTGVDACQVRSYIKSLNKAQENSHLNGLRHTVSDIQIVSLECISFITKPLLLTKKLINDNVCKNGSSILI